MNVIKSHKELIVYQSAFKTSMEIFTLTKTFPKEEIYSLTSQVLRSSRSVCANLAEAFRKRRYEKLLFQNYQIRKVKLLKLRSCWIILLNVDILQKVFTIDFLMNMKK